MMHLSGHAWKLNYAVVEPGKLLRSAQPAPADLSIIKREHGLGTILSLRNKEEETVIDWAKEHDVKVVVLKMNADVPPTKGQAGLFFDMMKGETVDFRDYGDTVRKSYNVTGKKAGFPFPVLIHCAHGSDRAGIMVASYRMAFQGWSAEKTKKEMLRHLHFPFAHPRQFEFIDKMSKSITPCYGSQAPACGKPSP